MPEPHPEPDSSPSKATCLGWSLGVAIWGSFGTCLVAFVASVWFFLTALGGQSHHGFQLAFVGLIVAAVSFGVGVLSTIGLFTTSARRLAKQGFSPGWGLGLGVSGLILFSLISVAAPYVSLLFPPQAPTSPRSSSRTSGAPPLTQPAPPRLSQTDKALALLKEPTTRLAGLTALVDLSKSRTFRVFQRRPFVAAQVIPFLNDPDPQLRAKACTVLSYVGHARHAADRLIEMVESDADSTVRVEAAWALVGTRHPRVVPVLIATISALRSRTPPSPVTDPLLKGLIGALKRVQTGISQDALTQLRNEDPDLQGLIPPDRRRRYRSARSKGAITQYEIAPGGRRIRLQYVKRGWSCQLRPGVSVSVAELTAKSARLTVRRGPYAFDAVLGDGEWLHAAGGFAVVRLLADKVELRWKREPPKTVALTPPAAPSDLRLPAMSVRRLPDGRVVTAGNVRDDVVTVALFPADYATDTTSGFDEHAGVGQGATLTGAMGNVDVVRLTPGSKELPGLVEIRVR